MVVYAMLEMPLNIEINLILGLNNVFLLVIPLAKRDGKCTTLEQKEFLVSGDVIFYEHVFPFIKNAGNPTENTCMNLEQQVSHFQDGNDSQDETEANRTENAFSEHPAEEQGAEIITAETAKIENGTHSEGESQIQHQQTDAIQPRTRQPPAYLKDYYLHHATQNPTYKSLDPSPKDSIVYPVSQYLDYIHFFRETLGIPSYCCCTSGA